MKPPPSLTPRQLETLVTLRKLQNGRILFFFLLIAFVVVSCFWAYVIFGAPCESWDTWTAITAKTGVSAVETALGGSLGFAAKYYFS